MKITVINGTGIKGVTWHMKERFLEKFRDSNEITEFVLPKDMPEFCVGCKNCFFKGETLCPHEKYITPIWTSLLAADLIIFAYPVYALRAPGSIKALLDHLCVHWMVHRPERDMFSKQAVIITNSVGAPNTAAQKDVSTSLNWLGVSDVKCLGIGLMEGVIWSELSEKRKKVIYSKIDFLTQKYQKMKKASMSLKIRMYFKLCKMMHEAGFNKSKEASLDDLHYLENGWIKDKRKET